MNVGLEDEAEVNERAYGASKHHTLIKVALIEEKTVIHGKH